MPASEGALGLQAAGAEAVLTTLWPLHDEPTAYLIGKLYSGIASGAAVVEALGQTQMDTRLMWAPQSYWGGWVFSGPI